MKIYKVCPLCAACSFGTCRCRMSESRGFCRSAVPSELLDVLGRSRGHGDAAAHLRHLLPRHQDAEGVGAFSGGGPEPGPPQNWKGSRSLAAVPEAASRGSPLTSSALNLTVLAAPAGPETDSLHSPCWTCSRWLTRKHFSHFYAKPDVFISIFLLRLLH